MEALEEKVFYIYGPPKALLSDNGRNLTSAEMEQFLESWGVTHITTTPYHPMSNGMVERFNGTLATTLTSNLKGDVKAWDEFINLSVYAYNSNVHQSTGFTPFYLMFGKHIDPVFLQKMGCLPLGSDSDDLMKDRRTALQRISDAQNRNQRDANINRPLPHFKIGDLVLLLIKPRKRQKSQKLMPSYSGPHQVMRIRWHKFL